MDGFRIPVGDWVAAVGRVPQILGHGPLEQHDDEVSLLLD